MRFEENIQIRCFRGSKIWTSAFVIFWAGSIVRLVLNANYFQDYTQSDGIDYHNIAVNLVQGNGYSKDTIPPHQPYFFREPAYPLFLAGVYSIVKLTGHEPLYLIPGSNNYDLDSHFEIYWARIAQCLLGAITCVIFYLTLRLVLGARISFWIALLFTAYIPLAIYTTMLMRETLQTFAVVSMNYFFARFLIHKNIASLMLFSLAWALANMTLQVTILVGVFMFGFLWYQSRSLVASFKYTIFASAIMFVVISPWLMRSYSFYPDARVVKSLGISLTHESAQYSAYVGKLHQAGILNADSIAALRREWYALSEKDKFEKSFNGYFMNRIAALPKISFDIKSEVLQKMDFFRRGWIESLWFMDVKSGGTRIALRPHSKYLHAGNYFLFGLSLVGFVFGYLAIPGFFLHFRRLWPILLMFFYFVPLLFFIADETRRALPIHGYIFMFSCLFCIFVFQKIYGIIKSNGNAASISTNSIIGKSEPVKHI